MCTVMHLVREIYSSWKNKKFGMTRRSHLSCHIHKNPAMCLYFAEFCMVRTGLSRGAQLLLSFGESASFGIESRRHTADLLVDIMLAVPCFSAPVWTHYLAGENSGVYFWDYEVDLSSVLLINCLKQWVKDKWGVSNNVPTVGWLFMVILNADLRGSLLCVMNVQRAKKKNS